MQTKVEPPTCPGCTELLRLAHDEKKREHWESTFAVPLGPRVHLYLCELSIVYSARPSSKIEVTFLVLHRPSSSPIEHGSNLYGRSERIKWQRRTHEKSSVASDSEMGEIV